MKHFRKTLYRRTGMTLTELLTATILVGIVMAGIISVDYSIRKMRGSSGKMANVMGRSAVAMVRLARDAQKTVGDNSNPNNVNNSFNTVGVYWSTTGTNEICFRHADTITPMDYSDDKWTCYTHQTGNFPLYRCNNLTISPTPLPATCPGGSEVILDNLAQDVFFTVYPSNGPIQYIDFTLQHCEATAACHPIDNPMVTERSRVTMSGLSRY